MNVYILKSPIGLNYFYHTNIFDCLSLGYAVFDSMLNRLFLKLLFVLVHCIQIASADF